MSYYSNPNRHVYMPSSHTRVSMRPNLSWSTIREESSSDFMATEQDEKKDRLNRLKKLERLKERRYMDYQSLKRRGGSKEYSDRFHRDCEEFNKLKYRQVHHTPNTMLFSSSSKNRSVSVSDLSSKRYLHSSRYGHTYLRGNHDDGQTLSPTGSVSSIVTLDDDYMYGSRYRTGSLSTSMVRDRLGHYGLSSHEMLDDNLFDDASSEYSFSGYVPQRRAFSSCVTPRKYSGLMTPTADNADAAATVERMNQLQERLKLLQTERSQLERRRSVDLSTSQMRSRLASLDHTDTASASIHSRFSHDSQSTILPQSPTDPSIPAWSQRVNLLLSSHRQQAPDLSPDMDYSSSHSEIHHVEPGSRYATDSISRHSSEILDSTHSANVSGNQSFHSMDPSEPLGSNCSTPNTLSRSFIYQRPESSSTPMTTSTSEMRQERHATYSPSHLSMTTIDRHHGSVPIDASHGYQDSQQFQTSHSNTSHIINVTGTNKTINLQRPGSISSRTDYSTHVLKDGQYGSIGADRNSNSQRITGESRYITDVSPSPLSPESQNKNFVTHETKTFLIQKGQDDISDSGMESSSDVGRVSSSVSSDSISKFVVSASKPSESRGRTKFEISLGLSGQKAGSSELSPEDAAYHSVQESPQEETATDGQDSTSYHSTTTSATVQKYGDSTHSSDFRLPQDSKTQTRTTVTEQYNTGSGQHHDSVQADKTVFGRANVISRKARMVDHASNNLATVNVEMGVPQPRISGSGLVSEHQALDISQQQSTKTLIVSPTKESAQKKQVSSDMQQAEIRPSSSATLKMVTQEFPRISAQLEQKEKSVSIQSGQKQPEENVYDSSESVTLNIKGTSNVDPRNLLGQTTKSDTKKDNSSIFQQNDSETRRIENNSSTTTTFIKTVDSYSPETKEQISGINAQTLKSADPKKDAMSQVVITTNKVSETMPSVKKTETIEIQAKRPDDKNTNNVSKSLSSNQQETSQVVFKNVSDKLESAEVLGQKSVEGPGPKVTIMEPTASEEQVVSDLNVITPKRKRSKRKKSIKGGEKNGLDSNSKTEEEFTTTSETSVDIEFSSSSVDGGKIPEQIPQSVTTKKQVQSPTKTSPTKPLKSSSDVKISKEEFQTVSTDTTSNVTIVETKEMMDATRETLDKLQSGDQKSLVEGAQEIAPSVTSSKLATIGYQMTSSVDNAHIQDPGKKSKAKPSGVTIKTEEQYRRQETLDASFPENEEATVTTPSKEKSKKKKKNSKNTANKKEDEQSESFSGESSGKFPGKSEDPKLAGHQEQGDMFGKVTSTTKTFAYKTPERTEDYNVETITAGQVRAPQQMEFTQGNITDKVATTSTTVAFKKSERPEEYNVQSVTGKFPGKVEDPKIAGYQEQGDLFGKVTTTTRTIAYKTSERPEDYNVQNISVGQVMAPQQMEFTQGNLTDKVATTRNTVAFKTSEKPEEYSTKSMSAKFPEQKSEFGKDSEMATRTTTTTKTTSYEVDTGMLSKPVEHNVQSVTGKFPGKAEDPKLAGYQEQGDTFGKVTTTTKSFAYKTSEMPEEYNVQNISAGQVMAPQQMEFTQGNLTDKVKTVNKTTGYKMTPEMSERPEEYRVQSISAQFSDQTKFPGQQTEIGKDGKTITTVTTTTKTTSYGVESGLGPQETEFNVRNSNSDKVTLKTDPTTMKIRERPEELKIGSVSTELPENSEDSNETEPASSSFFGRVASTLKSTFSSLSPGSPTKSPESPTKSEFTIPDMSTDSFSSVDPIPSPSDQGFDETQSSSSSSVVDSGLASPSLKEVTQTTTKSATIKRSDSDQVRSKNKKGKQKTLEPETGITSEVRTVVKTAEEENKISFSAKLSDPVDIPQVVEQGDVSRKLVTTVPKNITRKAPEGQEEYNVQSVSAEFPKQVKSPKQMEFTQGNMTDKVATTINTVAYKTSESPEDYKTESMSIKFPGQQTRQGENIEITTKVTTTTKTTSYEVDPGMQSGPEAYNVQSVTGEFPGKTEDPKLVGYQEQGDMFGKVTTTTNTIGYKTSERPEDYNLQNVSAEFSGQVKAPQQMDFTQGNEIDKVKTDTKTTGYKMDSEMSERPEEYHVQSISAEFPDQIKSPMQTEFTQGNIVDKVVTTTVSTGRKLVPGMSDMTEELKVSSMSVDFPDQVSTSQQPGLKDQVNISTKVVTTTETISEKKSPEISKNLDQRKVSSASELRKETESVQQGDVSNKAVTTSKDVTYKTDKSISEKLEELKAQTMSVDFPGMQAESDKSTEVNKTTKTVEDISAESPKQKSKSPGKSPGTTKRGSKKTSEKPEESNVESVSAETAQQPKDKQKKEKPGFLGKVATSIKSSFSKKSRGASTKPEEFPELVKDSSNVELNAANTPNDSPKTSYKSVVESGTVLPTIQTTPQTTAKDISLGKDDLDGKVTVTTKTTDYKVITEITDQKNVRSILPESPGQLKGSLQTEFTEGIKVKDDVTVVKTGTNIPEADAFQSVPTGITMQQKDAKLTESKEQPDLDEKFITMSATKTTTSKMSETPEQYNISSVSAEFPGQGPQQTELTQGNLAGKAVPEIKMAAYKMIPGMSDQSAEQNFKTLSAEFPGQQIELGQDGEMVTKVTTTTTSYGVDRVKPSGPDYVQLVTGKFPGKTEDPKLVGYQEQGDLFGKVTTTTKTIGYKTSESPEDYNLQNVSAEFSGQVKAPEQMDFTQGNEVDKVVTITKTTGYKMAEKPEEYHVQSISAVFPGQIQQPSQADFTQSNIADKVATTTVSTGYKMIPDMAGELNVQSMSAEFPGLVEGPKYDQSQTNASQISYKSVAERGIKPQDHILYPTTQRTDISIDTKSSLPNVSYTLSGDQPDLETASLETSHFTLEKPVTTDKTITKTVTTGLTNSPVDLSTGFDVKSGTAQIQEPACTLSQYDPRCDVASISTELSENLKSSETDTYVNYSTDFSTTLEEPQPLTRQKSWSDVVKNSKSDDVSLERSQPNISSSISIDKVERPGDRSPRLQQTENEGRIMSGESQAFLKSTPKGTSLPDHANLQSEDLVAPLKSKPTPPNRPLLRKLSGHDFIVADGQKATKPVLKLVAPDCTLLQTKFETDGWKPKVKSPTATMTTTTTIVHSELIRQSPDDDAKTQFANLKQLSDSTPVAPTRRSREFRSVSEDSTDGEAASPPTTLQFKPQVDVPSPSKPQVPKRKHKKSRKSDRSSSGSVSSDTSGSKNVNVSLNLDGAQPVSHPEFRMSDQDVFRDSHPGWPSPLESETRQNLLSENIISLNKSPHTSITSDSVDIGSNQEIKIKTPKQSQETDHFEFGLDDSSNEKNPPFERSYSSDKSRTMPLHRKNQPSSPNGDSDGEEKQHQPSYSMSPDSKQKRWKSAEILKGRAKPDVPPKSTGLNRVKSTSIKLLSKLQPKSKKSKSPRPGKDDEDYDPEPYDKTGHGATREYPTLEKYPGNKEPSSPNSEKSPEAAAAPVAPLTLPLLSVENDEPVKERVYLHSWDPTPLLKNLYEIRMMDDDTEDLSHRFIEMEGLMEKLPMNKKKATLLKTWKRRYFRARNGWLIYYDNRNDEKPSDEVLLMGGQVHAIGNNVIGIDDGRGRYLMVRCPSQKEYEQWLTALQSQTTDNTRATYVRPSMNAPHHSSKKVVMIEFGSMSIRAGILKEQATLPQLFFPNVVAISNENNSTKHVIGFDAYKPEIRHSSQLVQPFGPTDKVDKFKVDYETLPSVFTAIFKDLKIATKDYYVMLILPQNIRDEEKSTVMNILIDQFKVCGVCMAPQALLALYSYNAQSGIIVDIGERLEVLPIFEGFVIDGGHTIQSFGAPKIRQSLRSGLTSENYPLYSPLEQLLVRLVMEQTCFVSKDFKEDCQQYQRNPEKYNETVYLKRFNLPEETYVSISHSLSRFVSPEGLFNTDLWGMDYPTIQSLVKDAIEACPMDNRRHLCRSIFLSGGVTLLPGLASRLEAELCKLLNETIVIQVHTSPQRYHAAYVGACTLCSMPQFEKSCITREEWKQNGTKAFQKWKMSS